MLYFAVGEYGYEGGFTITASHNPSRYNGLKMVRRGALPVGGESGLDRVRDRALKGEFRAPAKPREAGRRATSSARSPTAASRSSTPPRSRP